eukprot:2469289-Amphidinium_carterae.1
METLHEVGVSLDLRWLTVDRPRIVLVRYAQQPAHASFAWLCEADGHSDNVAKGAYVLPRPHDEARTCKSVFKTMWGEPTEFTEPNDTALDEAARKRRGFWELSDMASAICQRQGDAKEGRKARVESRAVTREFVE